MGASPHVLIGNECRISGRLSLVGEAVIDGTVDGEIVSSGTLIIGESGVVDAKISGKVVRIHGRVVGNVECSERLELRAGSRVYGNLRCSNIIIEDGANFEGYSSMDEQPRSQEQASSPGQSSEE
ncbi:MAG: polymer-forming cytoskeletal protein [Bdellovibrionales bacterium]|nr:polymer-forming cytoskeletal protein [Bdellovibrionales bacterium]